MNPTTETFVETVKNRIASWNVEVTVVRTPIGLADIDTTQRWFAECGAHVASLARVKVTRRWSDGGTYSEEGIEVTFLCGAKGFVSEYGGTKPFAELNALVANGKGYLHGLMVDKKYGRTRGHAVPWYCAQMGARGRRLNANSAPRCCAAELYARAAGRAWGASV